LKHKANKHKKEVTLLRPREEDYGVLQSSCIVRLFAFISQKTVSKRHEISVHITCGLDRPSSVALSTVQYVIGLYFRFCGWRHVFITGSILTKFCSTIKTRK